MDASLQTETVLGMQGIGKRFGQVWVLKNVDVRVRRGSIHAIVGHNGAGKSTLMKIALGAVKPTEGEVRVAGRELTYSRPAEARTLGLGMVMQERSLIRTLSGLDNLYLNAERKSALGLVDVRKQRTEIAGLLEELAIPRSLLSTMTSDMSTIEQELIEIARALRLGSQVLILDEPTAPLGRDEITRLFGVLRMIAARGAGIVIITHHLAEVFAVSDAVTCLREGQVVLQAPTNETNMASLISAMLGNRPWQGSHLPAHGGKRVDVRSTAPQKSEPSLKVLNLKVGTKLADVSFEAFRGEVLGVVGLAGSGRTTLLRTLFGDLRQGGGEIQFQDKRYRPKSTQDAMEQGVFLIPEDRGVHGLMLAKSIAENITIVILRRLSGLMGLLNFSKARAQAQRMMKALDIRATGADQTVIELSGGNQQKVVLAKALTLSPDLVLLDEPTFGVDIGATHEIIAKVRAMADEGATILWASSDLLEVTHVADRIIVLRDGVVGATIGPEQADKFTEDALVAMMQRQQFEETGAAEAEHVGG
ncbi:MAG TPA: sugar ABC transporter ATP-binding protein [Roseiarcus sp.]|jgi:ribose transport system ATP-binding protein